MVIEAALSDGHGTHRNEGLKCLDISGRVERSRVVWVNAGGERNEARIRLRDPGRVPRLLDRGAYADDCRCAAIARASNYLVAVTCEGFVREVGVAVDEAFHEGALRGYLCSIQSSTGPAMYMELNVPVTIPKSITHANGRITSPAKISSASVAAVVVA